MPLLCQVLLPEDPLRIQTGVVLQILALSLPLPEDLLRKLVTQLSVREIQKQGLVRDEEDLQACLLSQEVPSLYLFDGAEPDHLEVGLAVRDLLFKEEDRALLLLLKIVGIHLMEEDKLVVRH